MDDYESIITPIVRIKRMHDDEGSYDYPEQEGDVKNS